jgi:hypothetical protein
MSLTDIEPRALKVDAMVAPTAPVLPQPDPLTVRIPEATRISGFSRSELYRRAARGEIILLKCGKSTLVEMTSLRAAVSALPRAAIRAAKDAL